jgi:hypothetical protein
MTTSGSTSFNAVRDQIVKGALRLVNAYASTNEPRAEQVNDALEALNILLKSWQVEGFLWLREFATLTLVPGQAKYLLPGATCVNDAGTPIARPTRITYVTRSSNGGPDIPMGENGRTCSREEYTSLPNKTAPGTPIMAFYDPLISVGALYLWPVPNSATDVVKFTCDRPIQDIIADTETFDVPQEQLRRIKYALALEIAPEYALLAGDYDRMTKKYEGIVSQLESYDREMAETQVMMAHR